MIKHIPVISDACCVLLQGQLVLEFDRVGGWFICHF